MNDSFGETDAREFLHRSQQTKPVEARMDGATDDVAKEEENFDSGVRRKAQDFAAVDVDNDNKLDFDEFCAMVRDREEGEHTAEDLRQRFTELDADGSGKVGRLLMNYFLIRAGYLPAVIHSSDRQAYYEALKQGPEALRVIIVEAMEQAVDAGVRHLRDRMKSRSAGRGRIRSHAG